jgi:predicted dithiol-disulfide oxidoreductase (DUF899 family)
MKKDLKNLEHAL